ncbi:hypothetical protein DPMN_179816 [Dreissena polymorpha]|uniref:Uncharacterized protein n=1 Tax=Dreissena polymorpha TaxID=45954 RepID=A0A9D4EGW6_DREPO|nr:hypothetical protein DPMN_179816 [Dreissena polymorpha]
MKVTHLRGTNILKPNTSPKTSSEQSAIFQLVQEINKTNAKNVTSIVKTAPPPWQPYTYKINLFTKFHYDWAKNVTSRVHVIKLTGTIFQLNSHIKETNVLTKVHENWAKNVTSRVFTCFHYIHLEKNAQPTGGHVFSPIWTIFELVRDVKKKTMCLPTFMMIGQKLKTAPPPGGHVFQQTGTTFELNQHIIKTNILTLLTKFHEDRTINVASRVLTNKCEQTDGRTDDGQNRNQGHPRVVEIDRIVIRDVQYQ